MPDQLTNLPSEWELELSQVACGEAIQFVGVLVYRGEVRLRISTTCSPDQAVSVEPNLFARAREWIATRSSECAAEQEAEFAESARD